MLLHFWMQHIIYDIKTQVLFKRNCRHSQKKEKRKRQFKKKKKKIERQMRILKNIHAHCAWNLFSGAVTSVIHFDNGTNGNNCYNWTAGTFWNSFEGAPQSHFATLFVSEASCHDKCNQKRIMDLKRSMKHKRMYSESASKSYVYIYAGNIQRIQSQVMHRSIFWVCHSDYAKHLHVALIVIMFLRKSVWD